MYSPLTKAAEGGGVGVGGAGVGLGTGGVGVLGVPKREAQADKPKASGRIQIVKGKRGLENIVRIIPTKNPSPS